MMNSWIIQLIKTIRNLNLNKGYVTASYDMV